MRSAAAGLAVMIVAVIALAAPRSAEERLRTLVAGKIAGTHPGFSDAVKDPRTTITGVATPFKRSKIWRFEKFLPTRALVFYVGVIGRDQVLVLTDEPERFNELLAREPRAPGTPDEALALTRLFDDTTRKADQRHLLVQSVDEIPFRSGLEGPGAQLRQQARQSLAPQIKPPAAVRLVDGGWQVTEHLIDGDALVELTFTISRRATIQVRSRLVRDDLPLVYVN